MGSLDTKQKVLLAFYTEYQKDLPQMRSVNSEVLNLDNDKFIVALQKLENEGLINGVTFTVGGRGTIPLMADTRQLMITPYGLNYVENKLGIDPTNSGEEKVKTLTRKVTEWGYNELKDFAVKVTAELLRGSVGAPE